MIQSLNWKQKKKNRKKHVFSKKRQIKFRSGFGCYFIYLTGKLTLFRNHKKNEKKKNVAMIQS
jgi:hypothetical protein